jgi:hypothetical protein
LRRVAAAIPIKTPQQKNAVVTCCNHTHGSPNVRVTTSANTDKVNKKMQIPHKTISMASNESKAFHLR